MNVAFGARGYLFFYSYLRFCSSFNYFKYDARCFLLIYVQWFDCLIGIIPKNVAHRTSSKQTKSKNADTNRKIKSTSQFHYKGASSEIFVAHLPYQKTWDGEDDQRMLQRILQRESRMCVAFCASIIPQVVIKFCVVHIPINLSSLHVVHDLFIHLCFMIRIVADSSAYRASWKATKVARRSEQANHSVVNSRIALQISRSIQKNTLKPRHEVQVY